MPKTRTKPPVTKVAATAPQKQEREQPHLVIPIGEPDSGHCPRSINTRLTPRQGAGLKALFCSLRDSYEKCEMEGMSQRGKVVEEYGHAVRWLLDRVADVHEKELEPAKLLDDFNLVL